MNNLVPSEMGKSNSKLAELSSYLLGKDIQSGTVHDLNIAGGIPSYQISSNRGGGNEDQLAFLYCQSKRCGSQGERREERENQQVGIFRVVLCMTR